MAPGTHTVQDTETEQISTPKDLTAEEGERFQSILDDLAPSGLPVNVRAGEITRLYLLQDRLNTEASLEWAAAGSFPTIQGATGIPVKNPLCLQMARAMDAMSALLDQLYRPPTGGAVRAPLDDDDDDLDLD
jgi:hypothetical protein